MNSTKNSMCVENLHEARSFFARLKGLLGRKRLDANEGLWIDRSPSIHTFFMNFPIDVVFLDRNFKVRAIYENIGPWRIILPVWGAHSVVEMSAGAIRNIKIDVGDQLNVVH